ncbi:MAG TPA: N(G),N(G)-dimethylarginine dimethylaminohydrolase [Pseudolysinimonas sp.]|nr:N(G),N(G)-dimethylarginine dimethylaminohydrolase [Pseudolysinimonas sp.]
MRALVRPTSRRLAEGQLTHLERVPVDIDLAERQWHEYCATLGTWGVETIPVPADDSLPDSVFVEDAVVLFDDLAVLTSPGAESRRPETDAVAGVVRTLGIELVALELPGTLDGGDVLKVGRTVYVGQGGRTNGEGIRQLRALLTPRGWTVVGVPVTRVLHLKSAVTALPDGTVIGFADEVDHPQLFPRFLPVPERGAAVVVLADDTVLMASSVPRSAELVESLGYRVVTTDISEFEKLEGCVTCLSVRIRS